VPAAPAGTTVRFGTLVAVAAAGTLVVYATFAELWPVGQPRHQESCQVRAGLYLTSESVTDPDEATWSAYHACLTPVWLPRLVWLTAGLLALSVVSVLLYRLLPAWRIRRSRLRRLDGFPGLHDHLADRLAALVVQAGLRRPPVFLLDPASPRTGGLVFGTGRHPYVCLDAGLVATAVRDRPVFDAIVLHELAHIRAGDVPVTYLTIAVWRSFLLVALLPYTAVFLDPMLLSSDPWRLPDWTSINEGKWDMLGRAVMMVAMVFLARVAVLRARECHADALVAGWTGRREPYGSMIVPAPGRRWWRWTTHPGLAARGRVMRRPHLLLRPGAGEYLALGLATGLVWLEIVQVLRLLYWYRSGNESFLVMRIVWGLVVGALICGLVLRGVAYRRAGGRSGPGLFVLPGLALGGGLVLSGPLQFFADGTTVTGLGSPIALALTVGVAAGCAALSGWAGRCAELAGASLNSRQAVSIAAVTVLTSIGVIASWYRYPHTAVTAIWDDLVEPAVRLLRAETADQTLSVVVVPFLLNTTYLTVGACLAALWVVPVLLVPGLGHRLRTGTLAAAAATTVWAAPAALLPAGAGPAAALVSSAHELAAAAILQVVLAVVLTRRSGWLTAAIAVWTLAVCCTVGIWIAHWNDGVVDSVLAARPMQLLPLTGTAALLLAAAVPRPAGRNGSGRHGSRGPVLALAALLGVVGVTLGYWPKAPGALALLPPEPATVPIDSDGALVIWTNGGGLARINAITAANSVIFSGPSTPEHYASTCRSLQPVLDEAGAFPPPPVEPVRSQWRQMLGAWQTAAGECVRVFGGQGGESDLLGSSFSTAQTLAAGILGELSAATARYVDAN
jgi:Zn-dependent protease with chaperone function